ncbi:hypothetical protein BLA24_25315 [Streptomyces cinnamoneus]|uniref:Uncharacterized protein n=1 Tax=Streptomyces cinnamoneus TaxID=53446 RepID=A0A2G1XDQ9_STRCJ|nr:hypothetical protein [Streptomyces cinnamoneus]PHQ49370.1 hypothetical protein BLA24_25315 [Streptomyces cinnamoneus]PPT14982.1 hypothetical protein CYQ11_20760 [Streptomyces cinnamoneus]
MTMTQALIEEATKKSGLIWVQGPAGPSRALWHVWHEGAAYVVGGPGEQPLDGLGLTGGATATVTVRSKDKGGRIVSWTAAVTELAPREEAWTAVVAELKGKRLNAPDAEGLEERWAGSCRVLRLAPTGASSNLPSDSLAAVPLPTPATTRHPMPAALPKLLRRGRKGR